MKKATKTRWAPSTRTQVKSAMKCFPGLRYALEDMVSNKFFIDETKGQEVDAQARGYLKRLKDHDFLLSIHFWLDVLEIESLATKVLEKADCDILDTYN